MFTTKASFTVLYKLSTALGPGTNSISTVGGNHDTDVSQIQILGNHSQISSGINY